MANSSIYAVFERMWQHVLARCNDYVQNEIFNEHIENKDNPHNVTKENVGLDNVDNTSDLEKPISNAVQAALDEHTTNMENPHVVTAEQIGALPIAGGVMEGAITLNGIVLTEGIDYGSGDPGSGVLGQLYFKKVTT
jgi:hypothetical protein